MDNSKIVSAFIERIWNKREFEKLDEFMHPDFKDHSLPPALSADTEGMKKWILDTGSSFNHKTIVEDQITEGDKTVVKIKMEMKHIGLWRNFEPTGIELTTGGYRYYKLKDGKIIAHWALIDGQAIESKITNTSKTCKIGT
jgi:predicted ester cyclase